MEEKYPVLYYDLETTDYDILTELAAQLREYFERENVPFILLPKQTNMKWLTKEEALEQIEKLKEYVETWQE